MVRQTSSVGTLAPHEREYDLIVSSGGTAAVLCGVGTVLACEVAGVRLRSLGGVSGGAIPTGLKATGTSAREQILMALEEDFGKNLRPESGIFGLIRKFGRRAKSASQTIASDAGLMLRSYDMAVSADGCGCGDGHCKSRPQTGLYGSEALARWFDSSHESTWPASFWTMATTRDGSQVVIDANGIELFTVRGDRLRLADKPLSLANAIRASCTIPGVLAALEYKGMLLFDGALSRDGICPVGVQIRNYGVDPKGIIACRVNEDALRPISGRVHRLARQIWRVHPEFSWGEETAGVIEFRAMTDHIHTLRFSLSRDAKWLAMMVAFEACVSALAVRRILVGEQLELAESVLGSMGFWRDAHPSRIGSRQVLSERIERCLTDHGLL